MPKQNLAVNSEKFLPFKELPIVPELASIKEIFERAHKHGVGGVVVSSNFEPVAYVVAQLLALATSGQAERLGWEFVANQSVRDFLTTDPTPALCVRIANYDVDISLLENCPDTVFQIREGGKPVGWFLNHETVLKTIQTPAPTFLCERGHQNSDPDTGYCHFCPAKIKS